MSYFVTCLLLSMAFGYTTSVLQYSPYLLFLHGGHFNPTLCDAFKDGSRQKKFCTRHPEILEGVRDGVRLAREQCQHQFRHSRWNCSGSLEELGTLQEKRATRESAFLQAITPAAVTYAVALYCARSKSRACNCDNRKLGKEGRDANGTFKWGGCSLDLKKGRRFANAFVQTSSGHGSDAVALMIKHNIRVGRKAVREFEAVECRCHGLSGSCTSRQCWQSLRDFSHVGDYLHARFNKAVRVTMHQDGTRLVPKDKPRARISRQQLVYLESSPDFCSPDLDNGALGTAGRECSKNESAANSCDYMCCGRGYDTVMRTVKEQCNCRFVYCCTVNCDVCKYNEEVHLCKAYGRYRSTRSLLNRHN